MVCKIFIEDGLTLYNKTGIGQYTQNLICMLNDLDFEIVMPRKYFLEKIKNSLIKRILYVLWLNLIFPWLLISSGAEKVIFTNYLTPLYKLLGKKYYSIIYDLSAIKYPETMIPSKQKYQQWILDIVKNTYYRIITDSNTAKKEIIEFYNCNENEVQTIYPYFSFGENPDIKMSEQEQNNTLDKYNITEKKYILSVGSLNKRKNIQSLIDAYNLLKTNIKLVIAGARDNQNIINKNNNIIFTGYINDEELKVLYKNALIYVFPSIYEGFGIPLIDAQSFGIPVLCSDIPVFHEIGGDSVDFCGTDAESIKEKLSELLNDRERQKILEEKGYENIKRFSKKNLLKQLEEALN